MRLPSKIAVGVLAGTALLQASALNAQTEMVASDYVSPISANAEAIRSLNIMLMVTSLRCRTSAFDFRSEYDMFARTHQANLAEAHDTLARNMAATHGEDGSHRALDRIGVRIANRYGEGHPTLGCSDLKDATLQLAMSQDRANLSRMADRLLSADAAVSPQARQAAAQPPTPTSRHARPDHDAHIPYELNTEPSGVAESQLPDAMQLPLWQRG